MSLDLTTPVSGAISVAHSPAPVDANLAFQKENIAVTESIARNTGEDIKIRDVLTCVNLDADYSYTRKWAIQAKVCTAKEFDHAVHVARVVNKLDAYPTTAEHFLAVMCDLHGWRPDFHGMVSRRLPSVAIVGGHSIPFSDADLTDAFTEPLLVMQHKAKLTLDEVELELRMERDRLKLGFSAEQISDAVSAWHAREKQLLIAEMAMNIGASPLNRPGAEYVARCDAIWLEMAEKVFDLKRHSAAYCVAVLKKFMWQLKRKMRDLPVTDHLMPVALGPQGVGKTTFISAMLSPIKDLTADVDFGMIEDSRNVTLWSNYALFIDEMGYASKANVDVIKHVISAPMLSRRVMHTGRMITVPQSATFIGASNKELAQLIKDPTGMRRFAGIRFRSDPDWTFINQINWGFLWCGLDHNGPDPTLPVRDELRQLQSDERDLGRVEQWLRDTTASGAMMLANGSSKPGARAGAKELYEVFADWQDRYFPGPMKMSLQEWGHEMKRLMENHPEIAPFDKKSANTGVVYVLKAD